MPRTHPHTTPQTLAQTLAVAQQQHQAGQLQSAATLYRQILRQDPHHAEALYLLGMVHHQCGDQEGAVAWLRQAIASNAGIPTVHYNLGVILHSLGRLEESMACYQTVLCLQPDVAPAHNNLGVLYQQTGQLQAAHTHFTAAVQLCPAYADAHYNLGTVLQELGQPGGAMQHFNSALTQQPDLFEAHHHLGDLLAQQGELEAAIAAYQRALQLCPTYIAAHCNLGQVYKRQGQLPQAAACYEAVLQLEPTCAEVHNNLGVIRQTQGAFEAASVHYTTALHVQPDLVEAHNNLGNLYKQQGQLSAAAACYETALRLRPTYAEAHNNLGVTLKEQGHWPAAISHYELAIRLQPDMADAYHNLGTVRLDQGQLSAAIDCLQQALRLDPAHASAYNSLGNALKDQGCLDEATACYERALACEPDDVKAHSNLLLALNYHADCTPANLLAAHQGWGKAHTGETVPYPPDVLWRDPQRRLRVGYVSPDFRAHSVAFFIAPLLRHHNTEAIETFCYADVAVPDSTTVHLRGLATHWRMIYGLSEAQFIDLVRADGIDILVDLAGHTAHNRLRAFAARPAPVQVTYLGYPNTTGVPGMAYRLTDAWADPAGQEAWYTEELLHLPGGFLCYTPPTDAPPVSPLPAPQRGYITFGSFNMLAKLTPQVVALWAQVVQAVPGARLLLKSKPLADAATWARYSAMFTHHGLAPERLEMRGHTASLHTHMAQYEEIDIALDPFPYNGTTTTCEALWMGVPVITLAGERHAGRVGVSLLTRLGQPTWIAQTPEQYIACARDLASDLQALASQRAALRARVVASGLCDGVQLTRHIEAAYRQMWQRWCADAETGSRTTLHQ